MLKDITFNSNLRFKIVKNLEDSQINLLTSLYLHIYITRQVGKGPTFYSNVSTYIDRNHSSLY